MRCAKPSPSSRERSGFLFPVEPNFLDQTTHMRAQIIVGNRQVILQKSNRLGVVERFDQLLAFTWYRFLRVCHVFSAQ